MTVSPQIQHVTWLACSNRFTEKLTHLEGMGEVWVLGGDAGGVHMIDMDTGEMLASSKMEDHDGPVTGLSVNMSLRHFISCGTDGMIKAGPCSLYKCPVMQTA